jgi:hypothetical protein
VPRGEAHGKDQEHKDSGCAPRNFFVSVTVNLAEKGLKFMEHAASIILSIHHFPALDSFEPKMKATTMTGLSTPASFAVDQREGILLLGQSA